MKKSLLFCLSALLLVTGCKKDVESVTVIPDSISLSVGKTYQLQSVVSPKKAPQNVEWTSSNPEVATVSAGGLVTAVALGECEISVYADVQKAVCRVKVTDSEHTFTVNGVAFKMIRVENGTFRMGATNEQGDEAEDDEKPAHDVTLSAYYIGETEVTQALWKAVMASEPTDNGGWADMFGKGDDYPVYRVSWEDCQDFITRLNGQFSGQLGEMKFALPTEAQWEYAARGGKKSMGYKYAGSNTLADVAWYTDNSGNKTHAVKGKKPNELGLYDMSGNVSEWCSDWYAEYLSGAQTDPQGPGTGERRVTRSSHYDNSPKNCRVSVRGSISSSFRSADLGFRLVLVP